MRNWVTGISLWLTSGFRAAPALAAIALCLRLATTISLPVQAYAVKLLVDGVLAHDGGLLLTGAAILAGTLAVTLTVLAFDNAVFQTMLDHVHTHLSHGVIRTIAGIPGVEHHERPDVADRIELLRREGHLLTFSFSSLLAVLAAFANAGVVLGLLAGIHPLLLALPLLGLVRVWTSYVNGRLQWGAKEATAQDVRRADRIAELGASPRNALEIRVFGLREVFLRWIDTLLGSVESQRLRASRTGATYEVLARLGFGVVYGAAIVFVAFQARSGTGSPGDLALLVLLGTRIEAAASGIADATRDTGQTIRLFTRLAWLRQYARQAAWSDSRTPAPDRLTRGISLRGVEFRYPGTATPVLHDIDLELPAGAVVALVGENGAGKSTLVKLLTRLHDPTSGTVLVDGQDLRTIDPEAWRHRVSAAFQDFVRYELTAAETVGVGDLPRVEDERAVRAALARGGAEGVVAGLPDDLKTQLGRRFTDGVDLSGGQWQKLALSRAFMRTHPLLLVLDEPTAALDPEAEHALFERYAHAATDAAERTGGITVLVSHRFSTVRMADLIVVLENGRIVEIGTHAGLLARNGLYTALFSLQARAYQDG